MGGRTLTATRHDSELGSWEMIPRRPGGIASAFVRRIDGYRQKMPAATQRQMPSGLAPLIINIGAPLEGAPAHRESELRPYQAFVAGLHDSYATTRMDAQMTGVQVDFSPLGMHLFLGGMPMHELANEMVELDEVLGAEGRDLVERLQETVDWEPRFELIEAFLESRLTAAPAPAEDVAYAWERLQATAGCLAIGTLAGEMGYSRKQLIARFRTHIGLPPKLAARVLRFRHAIELLDASEGANWSDIAFDAGYYDQAHLIRDFAQFAGSTPTEYVARRLPDNGGVRGD